MVDKLRVSVTLLVWSLVIAAGLVGLFRPLDDALRDLRFGAQSRQPSGKIVFVDINSRSIDAVGVWPWPRSVHGKLVDKLMDAGAGDVAFDVDFSTPSTEAEDAAFEAALERAGGYVHLAALRQLRDAGGRERYNLPLPRFRQYADAVAVNVLLDGSAMVRSYPFGMTLGGVSYPSLGAALTGVEGPPDRTFIIDYAIEPASIDRISVADILAGSFDPARIEGKGVVVGASALELRDTFVVPRHGVIPGALVQILGAETLWPGRLLRQVGWGPAALMIGLMGLAFLLTRLPLVVTAIGGLALLGAIEATALLLQTNGGQLLNTAAIDVALAAFLLSALLMEIRERRRAHAEAARQRDETQGILDRVIADNFDGVVVVDAAGHIVAASRLAEEMLGAGLVGRQSAAVLPAVLEEAIRHLLAEPGSVGSPEPAELTLGGEGPDPRIIEYAVTRSEVASEALTKSPRRVVCLTFRDITERRRSELRLHYLASHDPLTGALSRRALAERILGHFAAARGRAAGGVLVIVDLSRFKTVNEALGHEYGDQVLKQVASRLGASGAEAIARLGGDSFALFMGRAMTDDEIVRLCTDVVAKITLPYALSDGRQALIGAQAGATHSGLSGFDPDVLLSNADMALSAAKAAAGRMIVLFAPEMDVRLKNKKEMDAALRLAVERGELALAFQPQVDLATEQAVGVEALLRWKHPELGMVSPAEFIPLAEETGQILDIGRWVLKEACRQAAGWPKAIRIAVNVSPIQFEMGDIAGDVRDALRSSGLAAGRLDIEITEGVFVSKSAAIAEAMRNLRELGIGIALDDFGTGYSSLSYLGRLPVDKVKIDQSFVKRLPADAEAEAIVRAVLALSATLDKVVVAEGIETADQARMLRSMGCRIGQGYLFAHPMTGIEIQAWLTGQRPGRQAAGTISAEARETAPDSRRSAS